MSMIRRVLLALATTAGAAVLCAATAQAAPVSDGPVRCENEISHSIVFGDATLSNECHNDWWSDNDDDDDDWWDDHHDWDDNDWWDDHHDDDDDHDWDDD